VIGKALRAAGAIVGKELLTSFTQNAAAKIGEAVGRRIATRIHPEPPEKGADVPSEK
jgi:hypothetical protein